MYDRKLPKKIILTKMRAPINLKIDAVDALCFGGLIGGVPLGMVKFPREGGTAPPHDIE